jgi:hypothetical protein
VYFQIREDRGSAYSMFSIRMMQCLLLTHVDLIKQEQYGSSMYFCASPKKNNLVKPSFTNSLGLLFFF